MGQAEQPASEPFCDPDIALAVVACLAASGSLAMLAAMRRASSGGVAALLATHQPQELGFVNVAVFDEAGD